MFSNSKDNERFLLYLERIADGVQKIARVAELVERSRPVDEAPVHHTPDPESNSTVTVVSTPTSSTPTSSTPTSSTPTSSTPTPRPQ